MESPRFCCRLPFGHQVQIDDDRQVAPDGDRAEDRITRAQRAQHAPRLHGGVHFLVADGLPDDAGMAERLQAGTLVKRIDGMSPDARPTGS